MIEREFSEKRADLAFVTIAKLIAAFRNDHDYTNEEMAYALLQICACTDSGGTWQSFLKEALNECINEESAS